MEQLHRRKIRPGNVPPDNKVGLHRIYAGGLPHGGSMELVIVIVLLLLLFGSFPTFPYSRNWGYYPSSTLGTILLIVVILWLLKVI
jgi:hypothetical protein